MLASTMDLDALLSDDAPRRASALELASAAPDSDRSSLVASLTAVVRDVPDSDAELSPAAVSSLAHACTALAALRVESARNTLLRLADEGTAQVKVTLARALASPRTPIACAVLLHLLSDDDARTEAIVAIGAAPWPAALPALVEVAESDDHAARLAALPIARCGAAAGPREANAAADFLLEQLDDDVVLGAAAIALLRHGGSFLGVAAKGRLLAKEPGKKKACGVCLVAAFGDEGSAGLLELALAGQRTDEAAAAAFLQPLLVDPEEHVRAAAARAAKALGVPTA